MENQYKIFINKSLSTVPIFIKIALGPWSLELQQNVQINSVQLLQEYLSLYYWAVVRHLFWLVRSSYVWKVDNWFIQCGAYHECIVLTNFYMWFLFNVFDKFNLYFLSPVIYCFTSNHYGHIWQGLLCWNDASISEVVCSISEWRTFECQSLLGLDRCGHYSLNNFVLVANAHVPAWCALELWARSKLLSTWQLCVHCK